MVLNPTRRSAMIKRVRPLQVYVVEDSEIILRLLDSAIEASGSELIGHAADAEQAIHDLQSLKPDLVLIDLVLVSGTGFDVLEALRTRKIARKAIAAVFTNHVSDENRARSFRLGASYVFDKSTQGWEALHLINKMSAARARRRSPGAERREVNGER